LDELKGLIAHLVIDVDLDSLQTEEDALSVLLSRHI
jgi:hypothetical protein